jgi:uncharacterized protein (TIGR04255 family)
MQKSSRRKEQGERKQAASPVSQLPNAPLVEVVFELRWRLHGGETLPVPFRTDPGVLPLLHAFSSKAEKLGFPIRVEMAPPEQVVGHSVTTRFRKSAEFPFPLLQIGSGIFAANDGLMYEWKRYKAHVLAGVAALLDSYPKLTGFPFNPNYLELRYSDAFDETLLDTPDLLAFLSAGTSLQITAPKFITDSTRFEGPILARIALQKSARGWPSSRFFIEVASASNTQNRPSFQLQTKVVTEATGVPALGASFRKQVGKWLEFAHGLTSPFFRSFIKDNLMAQFEAPPK